MKLSTLRKPHWLDIAEIAAVVGSVGGSITSVFFKQFLWATIPLSVSAALASLNHQRLKNLIKEEREAIAISLQENQAKINNLQMESGKYDQENKASVAELEDELGWVRNLTITELARLQQEENKNSEHTNQELQKLQISLAKIDSLSQRLEQDLNDVDHKQKETGKLVRELKAIDIFTQNINADLNTVQSYFERGFAYQRLGNKHRAINDYSKTLELDSNHAQAYHNRGLLYIEMGIEQKAVIDLRRASQLYFDKGNLDKYRETRDLSQKVHQNQPIETAGSNDRNSEQIVVGNLFG